MICIQILILTHPVCLFVSRVGWVCPGSTFCLTDMSVLAEILVIVGPYFRSMINTKVFCPHCEACRAIALRFLLLIESFHPCCLPSCSTCLLDSLHMGCKTRIMFLWLYFFHEHLRICDPYTIAFRVFQCIGLFL